MLIWQQPVEQPEVRTGGTQMKEGGVIQVAYVVRDLDAAMKRHWEVSGNRAVAHLQIRAGED